MECTSDHERAEKVLREGPAGLDCENPYGITLFTPYGHANVPASDIAMIDVFKLTRRGRWLRPGLGK